MGEYPIECLVESLVEEYIKIRKRVFKEEDYKQYSYYHAGIEGKPCNPINILKMFISLIKDLKRACLKKVDKLRVNRLKQ